MNGLLLFLILFILIGLFSTYAVVTTKKALETQSETWLMKVWKKPSIKSISSSLISIIFGMIIGCIILIIMTLESLKLIF